MVAVPLSHSYWELIWLLGVWLIQVFWVSSLSGSVSLSSLKFHALKWYQSTNRVSVLDLPHFLTYLPIHKPRFHPNTKNPKLPNENQNTKYPEVLKTATTVHIIHVRIRGWWGSKPTNSSRIEPWTSQGALERKCHTPTSAELQSFVSRSEPDHHGPKRGPSSLKRGHVRG